MLNLFRQCRRGNFSKLELFLRAPFSFLCGVKSEKQIYWRFSSSIISICFTTLQLWNFTRDAGRHEQCAIRNLGIRNPDHCGYAANGRFFSIPDVKNSYSPHGLLPPAPLSLFYGFPFVLISQHILVCQTLPTLFITITALPRCHLLTGDCTSPKYLPAQCLSSPTDNWHLHDIRYLPCSGSMLLFFPTPVIASSYVMGHWAGLAHVLTARSWRYAFGSLILPFTPSSSPSHFLLPTLVLILIFAIFFSLFLEHHHNP